MGSPILPALRVLSALPALPRLRRHESSLSLQQYFQYDTLQQKLKSLEEENQKLRMEVSGAGGMPLSVPTPALLAAGGPELAPREVGRSCPSCSAPPSSPPGLQHRNRDLSVRGPGAAADDRLCGAVLYVGLGSWGAASLRAWVGVGGGVCRHCSASLRELGLGGRALAVADGGPSPAEASQQVVYLSDELARKAEDTARQQEEISQLLAQVVDLQQKCRTVSVPCPCRGVLGGVLSRAQLPDLPAPAHSTARRWRSSSSTWPWRRRCSSSSGRR